MNLVNRRQLLHLFAGLTAMRASTCVAAEPFVNASVVVDPDQAGRPISADFIGLSYESAILESPDYLSPDNISVVGLLKGLGHGGILRLGGNSSEDTLWTAGGDSSEHKVFVITPAAIARLAALLEALNWRLIYGLNLARGSPAAVAEEAAYVSQATGSRLLAFEIGNEPDVFGSWRGVRSRSYDFSTFLAEWKRFRDAIVARVPGARFAGPAIANQQGWVRPFVEAVGDSLVLVTRHYYADGPALASHLSLGALLSSAQTVEPILMELRTVADSHGLPFRIEETNSIYMEGQPGLSDAFASALWGLEFMFQIAHAGGEGVNFHTGDAKAYTPIGQSSNGNHVARPLYYGMLMFKEATRGAILVPTRLTAPGLNMAVYATRTADGTIKLCLINKDLERAARVQIEVEDEFATTSILRLTAPSASAQTEITFGGAIVDERGRWSAKHYDVFPWRRNSVLEIQAASAALAQLSH